MAVRAVIIEGDSVAVIAVTRSGEIEDVPILYAVFLVVDTPSCYDLLSIHVTM